MKKQIKDKDLIKLIALAQAILECHFDNEDVDVSTYRELNKTLAELGKIYDLSLDEIISLTIK